METKGHVFVTGAAGFLGSNLISKLIAEGHKVTAMDNLSMGRRDNLAEWFDHPQFTFVEADVAKPIDGSALAEDITQIVHLAAFKIPRYGNAIDTLKINYHGTENVLDFARERKIKCVLASTSDVYGRNTELPFSEEHTDSVIGSSKSPRWAYAVSKLFDEHLALAYQDSYGFPVTLLRFFGSYGPNQPLSWWGGPPPVFIHAVLNDLEIPIHGDGSQTRSFTFVSDTVAGIYAATVNEKANGEIINIGNNEEITILGLAEKIYEVFDGEREKRIKFVPYESFSGKKYQDVMRRVPDNSLCRELLGVSPQVSLAEGLKKTIEWQRQITEANPELWRDK